jgi:hypothetical protein
MYPIATYTATSNQTANITFSSIPQNFTHLQIRISGRNYFTGNAAYPFFSFNGANASNTYWTHTFVGNGTSSSAGNALNNTISGVSMPAGNSLANTYGAFIIDIFDYTSTTKKRTLRSFSGWDDNNTSTTNQQVAFMSGLFITNNNSIASIDIGSYNVNGTGWAAGSRIDLYGISTSNATGV